ncbi:MAG: hypothetical protein AB2A00_12680 [Myxococcota bacterium]
MTGFRVSARARELSAPLASFLRRWSGRRALVIVTLLALFPGTRSLVTVFLNGLDGICRLLHSELMRWALVRLARSPYPVPVLETLTAMVTVVLALVLLPPLQRWASARRSVESLSTSSAVPAWEVPSPQRWPLVTANVCVLLALVPRPSPNLWYWEDRLHREMLHVHVRPELLDDAAYRRLPVEAQIDARLEDLARQRDVIKQCVLHDLKSYSPEVEAKVQLLARNRFSTALGMDLDEALLGPTTILPLPSERLLELLERESLWEDVDWQGGYYNLLVIQLLGSAGRFFGPENLPRLRALQEREKENLWWTGKAALVVGISRLLPPAGPNMLDDVETRQGFLRDAIRHWRERSVASNVARELMRVDLEQNWPFLREQFLAREDPVEDQHFFRFTLLLALGNPPHTAPQRAALADLLLDERLVPLLTRSTGRMGDDLVRRLAVRAVNRHAGREMLSIIDEQDLGGSRNPHAIAKLRAIALQVLRGQDVVGPR